MAEVRTQNGTGTSGVLAQVAHRAKVSAGTVSRVFNNSSLIPSETRCRVLSAARELGYAQKIFFWEARNPFSSKKKMGFENPSLFRDKKRSASD